MKQEVWYIYRTERIKKPRTEYEVYVQEDKNILRKIIVQASTGEKIAYNPGRYILRRLGRKCKPKRLGVLFNKYIIRNYAAKKSQQENYMNMWISQ